MSPARRTPATLVAALAATLAVALAVTGCSAGASDSTAAGDAAASDGENGTISLVAYSTPQVVYDEIIPAFQKTAAGKGVGVKTSFGASGDQSRAVEAGLKADVVVVLARARHGAPRRRPTSSPRTGPTRRPRASSRPRSSSFIVRKGNPKNIKTWDDLAQARRRGR